MTTQAKTLLTFIQDKTDFYNDGMLHYTEYRDAIILAMADADEPTLIQFAKDMAGRESSAPPARLAYYAWTLNSHELFGPFVDKPSAETYARTKLASYQILAANQCDAYMFESQRAPQ